MQIRLTKMENNKRYSCLAVSERVIFMTVQYLEWLFGNMYQKS